MYVRIGRYRRERDPEDWDRTEIVKIHPYDIWNADQTLALIIHPLLIKLKEEKSGYPNDFDEEKGNGGWDAWVLILDQMIWSFKEIIASDYLVKYAGESGVDDDLTWIYKVNKHELQIQAGLDLFGHYFRALWT